MYLAILQFQYQSRSVSLWRHQLTSTSTLPKFAAAASTAFWAWSRSVTSVLMGRICKKYTSAEWLSLQQPCLRHQRGRNDVTNYLVALRHGDEKLLDNYSNYVLTLHFNWNHTYQINYFSIRITAIRHNESDGVSNNRRLDCLLNRLLRHISKKTPKLNFTGFC